MPMFIKMGNGGTGLLGAPSSSKRAMARRLRRREAKAGYPWIGRFETKEQVDRYFSGDVIECLLCGRELKSLGAHLVRIHGTDEEKYKQRYGLPLSRGLTCEAAHENYSMAVRGKPERIAHIKRLSSEFQRLTVSAKHRKTPIAFQNPEKYATKDWDQFLEYVISGKTPKEASLMNGMPSISAVDRKRLNDEDFDKNLKAAIKQLPFAAQARMQRMGLDFKVAVETLFKTGLSDHKIAPALGVTAMTVNRVTKPLRQVSR